MDKIVQAEAVQRMQDFLAANLNEPVTLLQMARHAAYSPYYCARLFREYTGKSPFEYLRLLRLTQAAITLRDKKERVLDVALDFLFDSHEGFTRAFSREFGMTPVDYRRDPTPIRFFLPPSVRTNYLYFNNKGESRMEKKEKPAAVFVQVIERPMRKVILKRAKNAEEYFAYCEELGCDIWAMLCSVKDALYEPAGMWLPKAFIPEGTSRYVQGVEVAADWIGTVPEGFEVMDFPPCKMMVFQGPPYDDSRFEEAIGELWDMMALYKPELYGYSWADDDGPRFQMEPQGWRGYIEARPVRNAGKAEKTVRI